MDDEMRRILVTAVLLFLVAAGSAPAEVLLSDFIQVLGNVSTAAHPVENAVVVAFNLSTYYVAQTFTSDTGSFKLPPLPAGIYRIIAVKNGFAPAIVTLMPDRKDHRVALKLRAAAPEDARNAIWEVRRSLPSDVLREIDFVGDAPLVAAVAEQARLSGQMASLAAVAGNHTIDRSSYAQTAVGVHGNLGGGWTVDFSGRIHEINASETPEMDSPLAASSGVRMELRPSSSQAYRIASTRNSWMMDESRAGQQVDLEAHRFEWQRHNGSVQVKYFAHENLFPGSRYDAEVIEVSGEQRLQQSARSDFDVFLKIGQENFTGLLTDNVHHSAAVSATGRYAVIPAIRLRYGMHTYMTDNRREWAPETGAEFRVGKNSSIVVAALYKVLEAESIDSRLPSVVFLNQNAALSPKSRYSVAFVSGDDRKGSFTATANVAEIDSLVRVVFDDRFDQFWDAFFLESGDVYQDVTLSVRKGFRETFLVDVTTAAGRANNEQTDLVDRTRSYLLGTVQSHFRPTGTTLEVSYRLVEQPAADGDVFDSERLNLRMGQALHLPLDLTLLVGLDLTRAPESPVLVDAHGPEAIQRRVVGGISFAF